VELYGHGKHAAGRTVGRHRRCRERTKMLGDSGRRRRTLNSTLSESNSCVVMESDDDVVVRTNNVQWGKPLPLQLQPPPNRIVPYEKTPFALPTPPPLAVPLPRPPLVRCRRPHCATLRVAIFMCVTSKDTFAMDLFVISSVNKSDNLKSERFIFTQQGFMIP
jgi:hypothetical protein